MIQVDRSIIIQIFGSLMNKPEILNDIDRFQLSVTDFSQQLDKFIFGAIYNLHLDGAETIHTVDIVNYLQSNGIAKSILEKENGIQFLQDCESYGDYRNFKHYYNSFKKINLVRELQKSGYNTKDIYSEDVFDENHDEIMKKFETLSTEDIVNSLKSKIATIENKYVINTVVEETKAVDGIYDLIKNLKNKPEVGIRLQGDIFNTITRGGRKGKLYIRSAGSGVGKAVPNYIRIPTPKGWTTVGEIKVGDYLFDRYGKPTKVLAIYPQKEKKQVYKVYFKSGRIAECCNEHLWSYYNSKSRYPNKLFTSTLQELINNPLGLQDSKGAYRFSVPICEPVQYDEKEYSIDPYVMGLILGDGSFRYQNNQKAFYFSSNDEELVEQIKNRMGYTLYKKNSIKNYNWTFEANFFGHKNVWVEDILRDYPKLWQAKSEMKFIPDDFMFGSVNQRFDLLAGLLDTDGSIDSKGRISYSTVSPQLRDNVIELCESLGMTCSYSIDKRESKYNTGESYSISIKMKKEDKVKCFKLKRKLKIAIDYVNNKKRTERRDRDPIIKIESTNNYVDMTCFYVDNEEHLFLMNNYICTHNTRSMVGDACNIAYPIRFEPKYNKWVSTGSSEKVLYVMTEQDPAEIQTMILAYLTGYNEEMFLYGTFKEEHMDRIIKAIEIMEKYKDNMLFARIPDPCTSVVKNLFRRYNFQYGVENFFYDYIFSSPAMLDEYRDLKLREDVCLRMFTTTLKNLAIELNSFILTSTQISNDDDPKGGFKDFRNIRGSKAIADLADFACIMSRPSPEELKIVEGFQKQFNFSPNCITDVFKNRRGRWTMVRIWSKVDLGTCRKYDLFVTTVDMKPLEDFQIVDFISEISDEITELIEKYNYNSYDDENAEYVFETIENVIPETAAQSIQKAFGDLEDHKKRLSNTDWSELI